MGGGYLSLIYKLYKIKKEYSKERKLYKQTIKIFPNLIYPDIKTLNDYNDNIRVKFHLSYMLGETLIKADKNKFKGGYLTLFKDIKQTHKDYKTIKQLLSDFNITSPTIYNAITDNKEIFIKNLNKIENIFKTHKDYQAIIDNILHNFDYVLKHLDLIQKWLLSDDFYQRYKKENHPYPSLLDPKKLNDENEEINYNNIPAELAWEMNLPLPANKIVYIGYGLSGNAAMLSFLSRYNKITTNYIQSYNNNYVFNINYQFNKDIAINYKKIHLLYKNNTIVLVRDPIERLKHAVNHGYWRNLKQKDFDQISINDNICKILDRVRYVKKHDMKNNHIEWSDKPTLDVIDSILNNNCFRYDSILQKTNININYIDMKQITGNCIYQTLKKLADDFGLNYPNSEDKNIINKKQINVFRYLLPLTLKINNIEIFIIGSSLQIPSKCKIINNLILEDNNPLYNILFIAIYKNIQLDNNLIYLLKNYMLNFTHILNQKINYLNSNLLNETDCINYLKNNKELRIKLKQILDNELIHIKKHRPDIVASWRYYQEFEKMCEELDGKDKIEQEQAKNNN